MQARLDTLGNVQADALAGEGARRVALPGALLQAAREGTKLSFALLQRVVRIEEVHWAHYGQDGVEPRGAIARAPAAEALKKAAGIGSSFRAVRQRPQVR